MNFIGVDKMLAIVNSPMTDKQWRISWELLPNVHFIRTVTVDKGQMWNVCERYVFTAFAIVPLLSPSVPIIFMQRIKD